MLISFRTKRFDTEGAVAEGTYFGQDLAEWLQSSLSNWDTETIVEDWGWAVVARQGTHSYIFGVYDQETHDITELGPKWIIRIFNEKDRTHWFRKIFRYIPPVAHHEVAEEVVQILKAADGIAEVVAEPLT